jgi:hypothetical protein
MHRGKFVDRCTELKLNKYPISSTDSSISSFSLCDTHAIKKEIIVKYPEEERFLEPKSP